MENKKTVRLNPSLQKVIDEAKLDMKNAFKIEPINLKGFNQIAQQKVAEWAKIGKQMENKKSNKKPGVNERFTSFMNHVTEI